MPETDEDQIHIFRIVNLSITASLSYPFPLQMRPRKPIDPFSLKAVRIIFPLSQIYQPDSRKHVIIFSDEGTPLAQTVGSMCHLEGTEGLGEGEYEKGKERRGGSVGCGPHFLHGGDQTQCCL